MKPPVASDSPPQGTRKQARQQKEAAALRQNLAKRKQQARARGASPAAAPTGDTSAGVTFKR